MSFPATHFPWKWGKWPWLIDGTTGEPNTGNYGVLYTLKVRVSNRTADQMKLSVMFTPMNGASLGSFLIDGKLYETGVVKPPESRKVTEILIAPREERIIEVVTLPEAGSCYPVSIKFTTAGF